MSSGTDEYWKMRKKELEIEKLIAKYKPGDEDHFYNGWKMYPEWWTNSTESWQKGFNARKEFEESKIR